MDILVNKPRQTRITYIRFLGEKCYSNGQEIQFIAKPVGKSFALE
jgi:hypothetical protein